MQGTAEGKPFDRASANELFDLADSGLARLFEAQTAVLSTVRRVIRVSGRPQIVIATRSGHKLRELRELLSLSART